MKKVMLAALCFAILPSIVSAAVITPVAVDSSSTFPTYDQNNLIDGSGLSGGLHGTEYNTMWLNGSEGADGELTFDLGGTYAITSSDIWQYNATCCGLDRGVKDFDILASTNGVDFTYITSATLTRSPDGNSGIPAQNIAFATTASYIRFDIQSNYGAQMYTGLSEVRFNGEPASITVPEPMSVLLIGLGLVGMGLIRKRS